MLQLVQSPNASGLYSTLVLLAGTTCAADAAVCVVSKRLEPLLDPGSPDRHYLPRRCCSLCNLRTPRTFTRLGFSWQARTVSPMLRLVQSPNSSGLYSTRVHLTGMNCAADAVACAVSERLGPILDPGSPGRHYLSHRYCSLCSNDLTYDIPSSTVPIRSFSDGSSNIPDAYAVLKRGS